MAMLSSQLRRRLTRRAADIVTVGALFYIGYLLLFAARDIGAGVAELIGTVVMLLARLGW